MPTESLPGNRVQLHVEMTGPRCMSREWSRIGCRIWSVCSTTIRGNRSSGSRRSARRSAGRELEIDPHRRSRRALSRVRPRAGPSVGGGQQLGRAGLIQRLLEATKDSRASCASTTSSVLPMANKDGVARGGTRFNLAARISIAIGTSPPIRSCRRRTRRSSAGSKARSRPADGRSSRWSCTTTATACCTSAGRPCHSSSGISRGWRLSRRCCASTPGSPKGRTNAAFRNSGTLGDGWLERYGIDAAVHEFNCNWIEGLKQPTSSQHWRAYGAGLTRVFTSTLRR